MGKNRSVNRSPSSSSCSSVARLYSHLPFARRRTRQTSKASSTRHNPTIRHLDKIPHSADERKSVDAPAAAEMLPKLELDSAGVGTVGGSVIVEGSGGVLVEAARGAEVTALVANVLNGAVVGRAVLVTGASTGLEVELVGTAFGDTDEAAEVVGSGVRGTGCEVESGEGLVEDGVGVPVPLGKGVLVWEALVLCPVTGGEVVALEVAGTAEVTVAVDGALVEAVMGLGAELVVGTGEVGTGVAAGAGAVVFNPVVGAFVAGLCMLVVVGVGAVVGADVFNPVVGKFVETAGELVDVGVGALVVTGAVAAVVVVGTAVAALIGAAVAGASTKLCVISSNRCTDLVSVKDPVGFDSVQEADSDNSSV